ncbi:acyl-CoA carboxylase subunit beta [Gordonia sp. (in: high G+C Gram-positive bacteria)]|uniref:acyl-CoA carboxylase subunit beta n=1 Tax=Gordonia sp. (in: high G+C Gram-positive bacteria) TaxID=84139 RepID=UPI0039E3065D
MTTASEDASTIDIHTTAGKLADLRNRLDEAAHPVGEDAIEKVHAQGRLTARERVALLLDDDSFVEIDALARHRSNSFGMGASRPLGDGVVAGYGTVDGREVCVYSQDATVYDGALGEVYGEKIIKVMDLALKTGRPVVGIIDGAGARLQEGVVALAKYGEIFQRNIRSSGVIPQISVVMGAATGTHVYSPALSDFVVMVDEDATMYAADPEVIEIVTGAKVTEQELGGARAHMAKSGTVHYVAKDEKDALEQVSALLSYLPSNNRAESPRLPGTATEGAIADNLTPEDLELNSIVPDSPNQPYDIREVITRVLDEGEFLEVQAGRAENIVIGFGRIDGISVGVVANQPTHLAGCLDIDASDKAARFIRTCDAFNVPIVTFVDVPGFLPGTDQEHDGAIRHGAKLLYAYGEATVGKITVVTRKAVGGAYDVMGSKHLGGDVNLAWPTAQIAVDTASGAVGTVYRKEIQEAKDKGEDVDALMLRLQEEYEDSLITPYVAAERGYLDAVIPPSHTRGQLVTALRLLERKMVVVPPRKHGNIPL